VATPAHARSGASTRRLSRAAIPRTTVKHECLEPGRVAVRRSAVEAPGGGGGGGSHRPASPTSVRTRVAPARRLPSARAAAQSTIACCASGREQRGKRCNDAHKQPSPVLSSAASRFSLPQVSSAPSNALLGSRAPRVSRPARSGHPAIAASGRAMERGAVAFPRSFVELEPGPGAGLLAGLHSAAPTCCRASTSGPSALSAPAARRPRRYSMRR